MVPSALFDNDVLKKCACFDFLAVMFDCIAKEDPIGVLGVAKFVVGKHLEDDDVHDKASAREHFDAFLEAAIEVEPTDDEIRIATELEKMAIEQNVDLDVGESQLCAIAATRAVPLIVTGDKRAIEAFEILFDLSEHVQSIAQRVACLEQLALTVLRIIGGPQAQASVCAEPEVDATMRICFSCSGGADVEETGLLSYIGRVRASADRVLMPGEALPT